MTLYRSQIVATVVSTLIAAATAAGSNVFADRDWPLTAPELPVIRVRTPSQRKEGLTAAIPQFNTTATINIMATVSGSSSASVVAQLEAFEDQIEQAILSAGSPVQLMVQKFVSVDTETRTTSEGANPIGDVLLSIACEFYEEFGPLASLGTPITEIGFEISQPGTDAPVILAGVNIQSPCSPITTQP
jgi:hypothetical protein